APLREAHGDQLIAVAPEQRFEELRRHGRTAAARFNHDPDLHGLLRQEPLRRSFGQLHDEVHEGDPPRPAALRWPVPRWLRSNPPTAAAARSPPPRPPALLGPRFPAGAPSYTGR